MSSEKPYNPLDKTNLGVSVADALLARQPGPLPPSRFSGAGIYAIYYVGDFPPYRPIAESNQDGRFEMPIYIGRAIPAGARKGGFGLDVPTGTVLHGRLQEHAGSIDQARNLVLSDFLCRYLVVEDIWIPLGEALLIERFQSVWNRVVDGFGNHDPGRGRYEQERSRWDALHPGRPWAERLRANRLSPEQIAENVEAYLAGRPASVVQPRLDEGED